MEALDPAAQVSGHPLKIGVALWLADLGLDLDPELRPTPTRFTKAMAEMTAGYKVNPVEVLGTAFDSDLDELVIVRNIPFASLCEHHLLPFEGTATVGYIPNGRVVGLSKIPRAIRALAQRLQIQERLTQQIGDALGEALSPKGVGVVLKSRHSCMRLRGACSEGEMVTSYLTGALRDGARLEFLALANH